MFVAMTFGTKIPRDVENDKVFINCCVRGCWVTIKLTFLVFNALGSGVVEGEGIFLELRFMNALAMLLATETFLLDSAFEEVSKLLLSFDSDFCCTSSDSDLSTIMVALLLLILITEVLLTGEEELMLFSSPILQLNSLCTFAMISRLLLLWLLLSILLLLEEGDGDCVLLSKALVSKKCSAGSLE